MARCNGSIRLHFKIPALGTYGTSGRGAYRNPGFGDVDLSVFKNTKLTERFTLQLRAEMFNLFNQINLAPAGQPSTSDVGRHHRLNLWNLFRRAGHRSG